LYGVALKPVRFRTSIPRAAEECVRSRHHNGAKAAADYVLNGKIVGRRTFDSEGYVELDCGWRDDRRHGTTYRLDAPRRLVSATPYSCGVEHGVARQWGDDGRLLGTYRMHHGTGIDLWWHETWGKRRQRYLAEVHFMRRGQPHGFEWWINEDQVSVHEENHWKDGELHGIERNWNRRGRLTRDSPKYFVDGKQVTRRRYVRAAATDSSLPPFRDTENRPRRTFPPVIARHLKQPRRRR
jgi:antitoxin component YwqK of YwqJK toxin-antitoxin module